MKNALKNIFDDTSMKSIHFLSKNTEKKYIFEFLPFFGPKIGQFCMKNGKTSVAFEKCPLNLDDFERQKGAKVVFLYIFEVELYPWKWYFEPYGLCVY